MDGWMTDTNSFGPTCIGIGGAVVTYGSVCRRGDCLRLFACDGRENRERNLGKWGEGVYIRLFIETLTTRNIIDDFLDTLLRIR